MKSFLLAEKVERQHQKLCSNETPLMKTVLIVDDRADSRSLLIAILAHRGYRLIEAKSGARALEIVRKHKPDLVIADVLMSKMDGYEFVRQLRSDSKIAHTPIVFYTASYIERESWKLAQACGVHHIIVKPAEPEEVFKVVDHVFARGRRKGSIPGPDFAREHLHLVTDKLAEKVYDLEKVNSKLEAEVAERKRIAAQLRSAHEEAHRAREDAERANRAKDNFLANLSHELRTPLTPVLMCAAALEQERGIEPEFRQQLGMMRRNVELEARLIDDLLDLTRAAHGKLQLLQSSPVDIHSLLRHTEQIVHGDALAKSVHVQCELNASEHHVGGDAARLHQVFWNLFKNAIKFTPRGGSIKVCTANPAPGQIVLTVEDNGIGIDAQTLPVIFRAFEQGETRESEAVGGLGLGLSISHAIVELHGGAIRADSGGPGLGAAFTVELATVLPFPTTRKTEPKPQSDSPRLRLLVVEDHEATLVVLARLLRRHGHDVLTASTMKAALSSAAVHSFDLVISDIGLPDGNGIDLMRQLTKDYGLRGIALSGYGMAADRAKTEQAGFLAHLVKPINFDQLHNVLQGIAPAAAVNGSSRMSG